MNKTLTRLVAGVTLFSTTFASLPVMASPLAAPISAQTALAQIEQSQAQAQRAELASWLQREDVTAEMSRLGVDAQQAQLRVSQLTDAEVAQLHGRLGEADAAAGFLGGLALVFVILLITDFLGLTKIFTFTRAVR